MVFWRLLKVTIGLMLLMVSPALAQDVKQYVDVHVHLRGTTESGMLGPTVGRQPGPMAKPGPPIPGSEKTSRLGPADSLSGMLKTSAQNLIKKMDQFGVQYALVVEVPGVIPLEEEHQSLRQVVEAYPDRLKFMAGGAVLSPYLQKIRPESVTAADRTRFREAALRLLREGAVGFGEMISYHLSMAEHHSFQYAPPDHPLFKSLADLAADNNVALDIHMEAIVHRRPMPKNLRQASTKNPDTLEPTIPGFEQLLKHNRQAKIVWQHIGWDNTGDMTPELVSNLLSAHSNLYLSFRVEERLQQVGNGPPMPNRLVDQQGRLKPEWLAIIHKFSERITIGSDEFFFPVETARPNQSFVKSWSWLDQLDPALARKIGSENPRRIYGLR